MAENLIEKTLKEHILEKNAVFVFPTQIAADLWADRIIQTTEVTAVPMEKFMAWDKFKGEAVRGEKQDKDPVPATMREVFAASIIQENAGSPFLKSLIVPEHAKTAENFSKWIASILPSLRLWKEYSDKNGGVLDDEDRDLNLLYERYSSFLDKYNLFDPAWERPPFKSNGSHYFLFFPQILSDWEEYKTILEAASDFITVVSMSENAFCDGEVKLFKNSRIELKNTVSALLALKKEKNLKWTDFAVSVPDMDSYGPYLEREMDLLEIPHVTRYSRPLSETGAGSLFSLISNCTSSGFSFESLKNLLVNKDLPWKEDEVCNQLISFGQKNHCICSFEYDGETVDVWEKSFKESPAEERLITFYELIKRLASDLVNAASFTEIREKYFAFRNRFFEMEKCSEKSDRILSRCIAELGTLIDLEEKYPECKIPSPYKFFMGILDDKEYLEQAVKNGVMILPYKTAALAPFSCHFIVDSSQDGLNVVWKEFSFLNEEKRFRLLNREESNVSENYVKLYQMNSIDAPAYFTCAVKTFESYSQAASYLIENDLTKEADEKILFGDNPYNPEKEWIIDEELKAEKFPLFITKKEKESFDNWMLLQKNENKPDEKSQDQINDFVENRNKDGRVFVSTTLLKSFYECPRSWLFTKHLDVKEQENAAELIDKYATGNLYHKIMELFCNKLKEKNYVLGLEEGSLSQEFKDILNAAIDESINYKNPKDGNCYLTRELLNTTEQAIRQKAINCVEVFCSVFSGCEIIGTEDSFEELNEEMNYKYEGRSDCLLRDKNNLQYILVDFKNTENSIPSKNFYMVENQESLPLEEQDLPDFQIPTYVYLYSKKAEPIKISNAAFFSIREEKAVSVFGDNMFIRNPPGKNKKAVSYEDFQPTVTKVLECVKNYVQRVKNRDFRINENIQNYSTCSGCKFNPVCRKTFNVGKK